MLIDSEYMLISVVALFSTDLFYDDPILIRHQVTSNISPYLPDTHLIKCPDGQSSILKDNIQALQFGRICNDIEKQF